MHRKGEITLDVSADLTELGKCGVAVVSSGIKSILDIPKTLEYLVSVLDAGVVLRSCKVFCSVLGNTRGFCGGFWLE